MGGGETVQSNECLNRTLFVSKCNLGQLYINQGVAACSSVNKGQYFPYRVTVRVLEIIGEKMYHVLDVFIFRVYLT